MTDDRPTELDAGVVLAIGVGVIVVGLAASLFVVEFGSATPEPVEFDETVPVGLTLEDELRLEDEDDGIELPRTQVFYSQYPYVVGYYGVESFLARQGDPTHERRFGFPIAAYVTDYADVEPELTADGLPTTATSPDWINAEAAVYVVDSEARTPTHDAVMPFGNRTDADAFAEAYGGTVLGWDAMVERPTEIDDATTVSERVDEHHRRADRVVETRSTHLERPVGAIVGEDAPTVQAAIDAAEPNTTVVLPAGTYRESVEVDSPVTLLASGDARIDGGGNGTVVRIASDRAVLVGVAVTGTGDATPGPTVTDDHAHGGFGGGGHDHGTTDEDESWDAAIDDDYAGGDAAIAIDGASEVLLDGVEIDTDAAGIILRDSPGFVVRNVTVTGSDNYREGHMGVAAMRSVGVVEGSTFVGGLDGVYTHRADGIVVRDNEMVDNRMGIHLMFTSNGLLANNVIAGQETTGIYVMTGPVGNGIVGNEISDTWTGISVGGSNTYVADNVLTGNDLGLRIDAVASIFEKNVIADNRRGAETWAVLPTNRVTHNDFVGNEHHVAVSSGRVRVWSHDGEGNYWEGAVGKTDGTVLQRPYTPTGPVDGRLHRIDGATTLAQAPALDALAGFGGAVPGMRSDDLVDVAPLCAPANPEWFETYDRTDLEPVCTGGGRSTTERRTDERHRVTTEP